MRRTLIGYYDDSKSRGGTSRYLMELLGALDRQRFQPVLFAPRDQEWHADLYAMEIEVVTLGSPTSAAGAVSPSPVDSGKGLKTEAPGVRPPTARRRRLRLPSGVSWGAGLVLDWRQLVRLFRRRSVDLLHSNSTGAEVAPIAARCAGVPRVLGTWHVDPTYDLDGSHGGPRYRLLERASMLALHQAISISEATRRDWLRRCRLGKRYAERVTVIPNGIDVERVVRRQSREAAKVRYALPEAAIVLGSLGRLDAAKGYEYAIRAFPRILAAEPRAHLLVAGRGPLEASLRELAASLGVATHVHFPGFVADVREVLECMDIYLQPSLCEAQGLGVLEAMALGLPVIASAVGGLPESVEDGTTGYVVPARDPGALAQAACCLAGDTALREQFGQRGRAKALREFTRDRMLVQTVAVYDDLLRRLPGAQGARNPGRDESISFQQTW